MTPAAAIDAFLTTLPSGTSVGVAVSGGSDSMALLNMLAHAPCMVCACTVHHHLRAEADAEAAFVAAFCSAHNISHEIVHWHWDGQGNLQDQARRARYGLLSDWASNQGLSHVALGHTADDNIETFLMGLSRGAGLDGLSGMRQSFEQSGVTFHRPLLDIRREDLREDLTAKGLEWKNDSSNEDTSYHRIRLRKGLDFLGDLGMTPQMLLKTISNLRKTRRDVDTELAREAAPHVSLDHGDVCFDLGWLADTSPEYRRRVLNAALRFVSGLDYAPRASKLAQIMDNFESSATLHGCILTCENNTLRVAREASAVEGLATQSREVWDHRWSIAGPHTGHTHLRALGEDGIKACPEGWRKLGLPRASVLASPSVWDDGILLSAPLAGWPNGWQVTLCRKPPEVLASILSH